MLRLIALYHHYRDLQEQRADDDGYVAPPVMRVVPAASAKNDDQRAVRALAA